jgi:transposase-like protein
MAGPPNGARLRFRVPRIHPRGDLRDNNRAANSHLPIRRRERKVQGFRSQPSAEKFLATPSAVYNTFYVQPHLIRRPTLSPLPRRSHRRLGPSGLSSPDLPGF